LLAERRGRTLDIHQPLAAMLKWLRQVERGRSDGDRDRDHDENLRGEYGGERDCDDPDGGSDGVDRRFPWLNDAAPNAMPQTSRIFALAEAAGVITTPVGTEGTVILPSTGWTIVRSASSELLFEHGPIGPREQPGHGHADSLSYELIWRGVPLVVDTGVSTYDIGTVREFERSAAAHATVSVGGQGADEPWASFRVGGRAKVTKHTVDSTDGVFLLRGEVASFRGWQHQRTLIFWPSCALVAIDVVRHAPPGAEIISHLPLAPGVTVVEQACSATSTTHVLQAGGIPIRIEVLAGAMAGLAAGQHASPGAWIARGIGRVVPRSELRLRANADGICGYAVVAPHLDVAFDAAEGRVVIHDGSRGTERRFDQW
jgi:Heparinase II/III-like protein